MIRKTLFCAAIIAAAASSQAATLLQEGFEDVPALASAGWLLNNASVPIGNTPGWYQGIPGVFPAQAGSDASYITANYNNAAQGGLLANALITPIFSTEIDTVISFFVRADAFAGTSDHLAFGLSDGGTTLSDFNFGAPVMVATGGWNEYSFHTNAMGNGAIARFAIEYTGAADSANLVGVDTFSITTAPATGPATVPKAIPEPATGWMLAIGLLALALLARRRSQPG